MFEIHAKKLSEYGEGLYCYYIYLKLEENPELMFLRCSEYIFDTEKEAKRYALQFIMSAGIAAAYR